MHKNRLCGGDHRFGTFGVSPKAKWAFWSTSAKGLGNPVPEAKRSQQSQNLVNITKRLYELYEGITDAQIHARF